MLSFYSIWPDLRQVFIKPIMPIQDGATCTGDEKILVVGATNRPQDLDEAARRRLVKRLYVPLPEQEAREHIIRNLLSTEVLIEEFYFGDTFSNQQWTLLIIRVAITEIYN